jgi:hypothetical protein
MTLYGSGLRLSGRFVRGLLIESNIAMSGIGPVIELGSCTRRNMERERFQRRGFITVGLKTL